MVGRFGDYKSQVSDDGTTLLTSIDIYERSDGRIGTLLEVTEEFTVDGFEFYMVGNASINHVFGELAESEGHHPAILTEWGRVTVSWWTHKIRGLHRNDFIMAAKTDAFYGVH